MKPVDVDLASPLPFLTASSECISTTWPRAHALVRIAGDPIGIAIFPLADSGGSPERYATQIWNQLGSSINRWRKNHGLPQLSALPIPGFDDVPPTFESPNRPAVTVIVSTRDRTDYLSVALPTLLALSYPDYSVIIVDNAPSTSATRELVEAQCRTVSNLTYIREDRPGLSWARNAGLAITTTPFVAFTDDDAFADPHWLGRLVDAFDAGNNVGCVTGLTLPAELDTPAQAWFEEFGGFNKGRGWDRMIFDRQTGRETSPIFPFNAGIFGAGVNMAFRTAILKDLGGFDIELGNGPLAGGGGEDIKAFFRVIEAGYQLVYEPSAVLRHVHRRTHEELRRQMYRYGIAYTAFLTSCIRDRPGRLFDLAVRLPRVPAYLFGSKSQRNELKTHQYPRDLTHAELRGMLYGPIAYIRSWKVARSLAATGPTHAFATLQGNESSENSTSR